MKATKGLWLCFYASAAWVHGQNSFKSLRKVTLFVTRHWELQPKIIEERWVELSLMSSVVWDLQRGQDFNLLQLFWRQLQGGTQSEWQMSWRELPSQKEGSQRDLNSSINQITKLGEASYTEQMWWCVKGSRLWLVRCPKWQWMANRAKEALQYSDLMGWFFPLGWRTTLQGLKNPSFSNSCQKSATQVGIVHSLCAVRRKTQLQWLIRDIIYMQKHWKTLTKKKNFYYWQACKYFLLLQSTSNVIFQMSIWLRMSWIEHLTLNVDEM